MGDYVQNARQGLRQQMKQAGSEEEKAAVEVRLRELRLEEQVMNVLVGAITGMGVSALTKEGLSAVTQQLREISIENSRLSAGVIDTHGNTLDNLSGKSEGVRDDGKKIGGTRIDPDLLCGVDNSRCAIQKHENGTPLLSANGQTQLELRDGKVQFLGSLQAFLESPEGQKMAGATGGVQGAVGTLFGIPYAAGSWQDKLIEAFAGTHDVIGGQLSGLYDDQGNARRGRTNAEKTVHEAWSALAIAPSAPFAAAEALPQPVWQAISILLSAAK